MIHHKTKEEIKIMAEGGKRLKKVVNELLPKIKVGISTEEIDKYGQDLIVKQGGKPSFKMIKGYHWALCLPINEQIVHTPPSKRILTNGDVLTIDIGMYYQSFHTDFAHTFVVGEADNKIDNFLKVGKQALNEAMAQVKPGYRLGLISQAIEKVIYNNGFFVIKELTGHGIGRKLHEDPYVFGFVNKPVGKTIIMEAGLVMAIEVIYSLRTEEMIPEKDNQWSIITKDRSLSACFEHTVAVTEKGQLILT